MNNSVAPLDPQPFYLWKYKVNDLMEVWMEKDWYHKMYGRYCKNVRQGRWDKYNKLVPARYYSDE